MGRSYAEIAAGLAPTMDRAAGMQAVVDALWAGLSGRGVSWVGFYLAGGDGQLVLGPRRDKPACSPIGLHGVCGRAWRERRPVVVRDVTALGEAYVACDPRDRSEVAVPVVGADGGCWGVLDLDSHEVGAFGRADAEGLLRVLTAAGLAGGVGGDCLVL